MAYNNINRQNINLKSLGLHSPLYGYKIEVFSAIIRKDGVVDEDFVRRFSSAAMEEAMKLTDTTEKNVKLRATICVIFGENIDPKAIKYCRGSRVSKIGERIIPVVYDLRTHKYHTFRWYNIWGFLHNYFYLKVVRAIIHDIEDHQYRSLVPH